MRKDILTKLQRAFVDEYLKSPNLNGAECVRRAGYKTKYPEKIANQLLDNTRVLKEIAKARISRIKRTEITQDMVLQELKILGCSDFRDYGEIVRTLADPDGRLKLKVFSEIKGDATRAIQSISEHITKDGIQLKFKLHSKTPALELLGKHLGTFTDINIKGKFKHEYILSMKDFKESNKKMKKEGASGP